MKRKRRPVRCCVVLPSARRRHQPSSSAAGFRRGMCAQRRPTGLGLRAVSQADAAGAGLRRDTA
jgi:hypothetical protein